MVLHSIRAPAGLRGDLGRQPALTSAGSGAGEGSGTRPPARHARSRVNATESRAGPMNSPKNPSDRNPPNTPMMTSVKGILTPLLISHGRMMLSPLDTKRSPHSTMNVPQRL